MVSLSKGFMGLTRAQTELVQHWKNCSENSILPCRDRLDPGAIKAHLSEISIIEVSETGRARFRLAGSGLRKLFGQEMRGRELSELDQTTFEMWSLGLARAFDMQQPIGGLIERETDAHAWLRLPLRSERSSALVLCHDALIPNARLRDQSHKTISISSGIAA
ncbi:MAG: PAS domain-containing protein [Henriciella sp.]|nr:PAS domain-containing protein [Henriciella sp.]